MKTPPKGREEIWQLLACQAQNGYKPLTTLFIYENVSSELLLFIISLALKYTLSLSLSHTNPQLMVHMFT